MPCGTPRCHCFPRYALLVLWHEAHSQPAVRVHALRRCVDGRVFNICAGETMQNVTAGRFPACLHAVGKASSPRLGIVYELQAIGGNALDQPDSEPVCICTASAPVKGLGSLCIVQIFTLPCSCRKASQRRTEVERKDKRQKGMCCEAGAACNSRMIRVRVFDVAEAADEEGDEEVDEDENESGSVKVEGWQRQFPFSSQPAVEGGDEGRDADEASDSEAAGNEARKGEKILHVVRPVCSEASCQLCRCCCWLDETEQGMPTSSGGAPCCGVNLDQYAQQIIAGLEYRFHWKTLVFETTETTKPQIPTLAES